MTATGPHELPLVGVVRFGSVDSPGGASFALFDLATAQTLIIGGADEIDIVMVAAEPGVSEESLTEQIAAVLPPGQEAITGATMTEEVQDIVAESLGMFTTFLLVFAVVGLVVAAFTIFNTFQILVTQRTRELALLRAVGASQRQVLGGQLLEATLIGALASVVGLGLGVAVAAGLKAMLAGFGVDIPAGGTVLLGRTVVAAFLVGIVVTVASAVMPARRASRIPPMAALRDLAQDQSWRSGRRFIVGAILLVGGVVAFVAGLAGAGVAAVGIGTLLAFVGVFTLGPMLARPFAMSVGKPIAATRGIAGELARENAMRNPKRTARTGGALMVGVALVSGITIIAASLKDWVRDVFDETFAGDVVVTTDSFAFGGLSPELGDDLQALPEVATATGIRVGVANVTFPDAQRSEGVAESYLAVDPVTAGDVFDIGVIDGSLDALTGDAVMIDDSVADSKYLAIGDELDFAFLDGTRRALHVVGIYTEDDLAGNLVVSHALHEATGVDQFDFAVYVSLADGVGEEAGQAAIAGVADGYANADVLSRNAYLDKQAGQLDPLVNLIYGLLGLAVIIALFSIANTMALSVHERTRELGLLRAVGMLRSQVRSIVRWETILVALLGTGLGLLLGTFFGWSISVTIRDAGLDRFAFPVRTIVVIGLIAVAGALAASVRPARRAARLDVLDAIATT